MHATERQFSPGRCSPVRYSVPYPRPSNLFSSTLFRLRHVGHADSFLAYFVLRFKFIVLVALQALLIRRWVVLQFDQHGEMVRAERRQALDAYSWKWWL